MSEQLENAYCDAHHTPLENLLLQRGFPSAGSCKEAKGTDAPNHKKTISIVQLFDFAANLIICWCACMECRSGLTHPLVDEPAAAGAKAEMYQVF